MKKPFLLIAGHNYYPEAGTGDWIACYETHEKAEGAITSNEYPKYPKYTIDNVNGGCDWYRIVDLREWTE